MDRMVGLAFGALAVQLLARNEHARMVALKDGNYGHVPIGTLEEGQKVVDVSGLYDPATLPRQADARRGHADVPLLGNDLAVAIARRRIAADQIIPRAVAIDGAADMGRALPDHLRVVRDVDPIAGAADVRERRRGRTAVSRRSRRRPSLRDGSGPAGPSTDSRAGSRGPGGASGPGGQAARARGHKKLPRRRGLGPSSAAGHRLRRAPDCEPRNPRVEIIHARRCRHIGRGRVRRLRGNRRKQDQGELGRHQQ